MKCSCPDWAVMCKHVAAVLYGVGARLDSRPELLFTLRGVDGSELAMRAVAGAASLGAGAAGDLDAAEMEKVFGIELDGAPAGPAAAPPSGPPEETAADPRDATGRRRRGRPRKEGTKRRGMPAPVRSLRSIEGRAGGRRRAAPESLRPPATERGDPRIAVLLEHFRTAGSLTNSDYRRLFTVETLAATKELGRLTARGILVRTGRKRGTRYLRGPELADPGNGGGARGGRRR